MFNFSSIEYILGEEKLSVKAICKENGVDFQRLIERSGFEFVYKTNLHYVNFFRNFILERVQLETNDLVIIVNQSSSVKIPGLTPHIFDGVINSSSIPFLEISDGCTGFLRALYLGDMLLKSKTHKRIHIICAEKYSDYIETSNNAVSTLFSDAISLVTIEAGNNFELLGFSIKNSFEQKNEIEILNTNDKEYLNMQGAKLLNWALETVPNLVREHFDLYKINLDNIGNWYIHQGSRVVVESVSNKIGIANGAFKASNYGNTVSSSIPILLKDSLISGYDKNKSLDCFIGFGVGLSAVILTLRRCT